MDIRTPLRGEDLQEHREFLRALARALLRDGGLADDVVQDAYRIALESPPGPGVALRAWLARVVHNLASNVRRGEARRQQRERGVARPEALPSHAEVLEDLELSRRTLEAVQSLPKHHARTLYLRFYRGLSVTEIAKEEGVAREAIKTRVRRALAALRDELDQRAGGDRTRWLTALIPLGVESKALPFGSLTSAFAGGFTMKKLGAWGFFGVLLIGGAWSLLPAADLELGASDPQRADPVAGTGEQEGPSTSAGDRRALEPNAAVNAERAFADEVIATSLEVRAVWEADGLPAAGVQIQVEPLGPASQEIELLATDSFGRASFSNLSPGNWRVDGFRGGCLESVMVLEGQRTEVQLVIPRAVDVRGVVRAPDGTPVPGARVWLRRETIGWRCGHLAALTDSSGSFFLRSVGVDRSLGARAPGFGPSHIEGVAQYRPGGDGAVTVELQLRPGGGRLQGVVLSPLGEPVSGAQVVAGSPYDHAELQEGGYAQLSPPPRRTSDEQGRFAFDALGAGLLDLHVALSGSPVERRTVEVLPGEEITVEIELRQGASVSGSVADSSGMPVPGVRVALERLGIGLFPESVFPAPAVFTDAAGLFVLDGLPEGELGLLAQSPDGSGEARESFQLREGEQSSWEAKLEELGLLRGRLFLSDGGAAPGWSVAVEGGGRLSFTETDREGAFEMRLPDEQLYSVRVTRATDLFQDKWILEAEGVRTGEPELRLQLPKEALADAWVTGRFRDDSGRMGLGERAFVTVGSLYEEFARSEIENGEFRAGPVPAGEYLVRVETGAGLSVYSSGPLDLDPGEVRDLGVIRTELPGSVLVELDAEQAVLDGLGSVRFFAIDFDSMQPHGLVVEGDRVLGREMVPGRYRLLVLDSRFALQAAPFEVRSGGETHVRARLRAGTALLFELRPPGGEDFEQLRVVVTSLSGEVFSDETMPRIGSERTFGLTFPPGSYDIVFETDTGRRASRRITPVDLEGSTDEPLLIDLE